MFLANFPGQARQHQEPGEKQQPASNWTLTISMSISEQNPDLARAQRLFADYQKVRGEIYELFAYGAPETFLPAGMDEIRQAIRNLAQSAQSGLSAGGPDLDALRSAYVSLANFLTDAEADAAARLQRAFERGERAFLASRTAEQVMARSRQIELDARLLAEEFNAFLRPAPLDPLLAEVDVLLAELGRKFDLASR